MIQKGLTLQAEGRGDRGEMETNAFPRITQHAFSLPAMLLDCPAA